MVSRVEDVKYPVLEFNDENQTVSIVRGGKKNFFPLSRRYSGLSFS